MSETLQSYVAGRWVAGSGEGREVRDAVTGETVTRVTSEGIDLGAAVAHARTKGGPALRAMTFHERAAALKAAAAAVQEGKDRLYELSARAGCTTRDAAVDVDGRIAGRAAGAGGQLVEPVLALLHRGRGGLERGGPLVEGHRTQGGTPLRPGVGHGGAEVDALARHPGDGLAGHGVTDLAALTAAGDPSAGDIALQGLAHAVCSLGSFQS